MVEHLGMAMGPTAARARFWPAALLVLALATALATAATEVRAAELDELEDDPFADYEEEIQDPNDPLEIPNRFIFAFNQTLDVALIRPAAVLYRDLVPEYVRERVHLALRNLNEPVTLANDLLQGDWQRAKTTWDRFLLNSTGGVLGFWDVATDLGHPYHKEDFGQTLGVYGVGGGPYIMLPLLGPSNLRDATGKVVDIFLDPFFYIAQETDKDEWMLYRFAMDGLDFRTRNLETLDEIERDALDFYARLRSLYRQRRDAEIRNDLNSDEDIGASATRMTQTSETE
ncbi:MAG: VacJ family lipoprotein [Kiloniellales bacterium]|nr:VacJ family lipoprotein [Kiloniellales bacterium]